MNYVIHTTALHDYRVEITSTPCNGDVSYVSYRMNVDDMPMQSGVCKPSEFKAIVTKWARRTLPNKIVLIRESF